MKLKKIAFIALIISLVWGFPLKALAETILERIERTGELKAGARVDAIPFGYKTPQGEWTGYSLELIRLIHRQLERQLQKPLKLNLIEVTIDSRFRAVEEETVDLMCGATTITQERLKIVDFSIPFFMTGSQFLVRIEDAPSFNINGTLREIPIAYIPNTTTDQIIRQIYPFAQWQAVRNREQGVNKLEKGEIRAIVSDGILLVGEIVRQGKNPQDFAVTPHIPMTTELYGCMIPKNNPEWKKIVDNSIGSQENLTLQDQWFNLEKGPFPYIIRTNL